MNPDDSTISEMAPSRWIASGGLGVPRVDSPGERIEHDARNDLPPRFLGQGAQTLGYWPGRAASPALAEATDDAAKTASLEPRNRPRKLIERGSRVPPTATGCQGRLVDPARAGRHRPGRDRAAAFGTGRARRSGRDQGPDLSGRLHRAQRGFLRGTARQLLDLDRAAGVSEANANGRYDRTIKAGQEFLKTMQWDESRGQDPQRRLLRRRGLRRPQQPARPVEHRLLHRGPARHRLARRRPEPAKGAGVCLAMPEPEERVQRPALGGEGQRRRFRLHGRQRRAEHGRQDGRTAASARMPA